MHIQCMQQMEHNRDLLKELCPEQMLEASAFVLGLSAGAGEEGEDGRREPPQVSLTQHRASVT